MVIKQFISKHLNNKVIGQATRYVLVGFSSVGLEFLILSICTELLGFWYIISNSIAYSVSFLFNFSLNRIWAFKSSANLKKQLFQYTILFLINFILSNIIMFSLTSYMLIPYMVSKVFATGAIVCWNFFIYRKIIYNS